MTATAINSHVLRDGDVRVTVLSLGCAVQDWVVGDRHVVLGYANPEDYCRNPVAMGVICGRVVNRIRDARFTLDGRVWELPANAAPHHIHGGPNGLGLRNWHLEPVGDRAVRLTLHSPHLDQGYPGAVDFEVHLSLDDHALTWRMTAWPDRLTPINLAQHLYFNLGATPDIRDHGLFIDADRFTPNGPDLLPTGAIEPVDGTRFDFRHTRSLRDADPDGDGYDLNFLLGNAPGPKAGVQAPDGTTLALWTDRPGLQLYTSNTLRPAFPPLPGQDHKRFAGLCLEAQDLPNAVNQDGFASILCGPDKPYSQTTTIRITPGEACP